MKINYTFANETIEIEVADDWGDLLIDLDRKEFNINHKETRRHASLDVMVYEGEWFAIEDKDIAVLFQDKSKEVRLHEVIAQLNPKQQKLIQAVYFHGITICEYALQEGVSQPAITQRLQTALKKIKKLF